MSYSIKDAKIPYYAARYHTTDLVDKIFTAYNDYSMDDSEKKKKIGRYSAGVAVRNIKKLGPKAIAKATATAVSKRTFEIVDKIKKAQNDNSLNTDEKRKKTVRYCLAIAIRRGAINIKND